MSARLYFAGVLLCVALVACAAKGSGSPSAKPVFSPNATLNRVGEAKAHEEAQVCMANAQAAGLTPVEQTHVVAYEAAMGGVAGVVGAVVRGRGLERAVEPRAAGVAREKPSVTYRHYVQWCLDDKGFDVIGWN